MNNTDYIQNNEIEKKIVHKKRKLKDLFIAYPVLTILSFIWILPLIWLFLNSFRAEGGARVDYFFPKTFTLDNYKNLFSSKTNIINFPQWYLNTLIVAIFTCIISTLFVLMVSFAFSRLRFKLRKPMMNLVLILGMFPGFMSMVAIYFLLKAIFGAFGANVVNTQIGNLPALIICYSATAGMGYYICKGFFDTVPKSLDEAAMIDGASKNDVFWKVILPLSKPIIIYTVLMSFLGPWMDFIFVRIIMKDEIDSYTVAYGLWKLSTAKNFDEYFTMFCAGAVLVAIPITLVFLLLQRFYVAGVTGGADKG